MRKIIGLLMLVSVFAGLFCVSIANLGIVEGVKAISLSLLSVAIFVLVLAFIIGGSYLLCL